MYPRGVTWGSGWASHRPPLCRTEEEGVQGHPQAQPFLLACGCSLAPTSSPRRAAIKPRSLLICSARAEPSKWLLLNLMTKGICLSAGSRHPRTERGEGGGAAPPPSPPSGPPGEEPGVGGAGAAPPPVPGGDGGWPEQVGFPAFPKDFIEMKESTSW